MKNEYKVRLSGLPADTHRFEFSVGDEFFDSIEFGEIRKGNLQVTIDMVKEESMIVLNFNITGTVNIMCDRSSELYNKEIDGTNQ